ncbi:hypothetical protein, partial [Magnetovibrio blakemorei]|uniref:hypothetical protein n=1 Tax=Magnetovibrio blakemorei TaxID=28181 RepID=UPI00147DDBB1
ESIFSTDTKRLGFVIVEIGLAEYAEKSCCCTPPIWEARFNIVSVSNQFEGHMVADEIDCYLTDESDVKAFLDWWTLIKLQGLDRIFEEAWDLVQAA